MNPFGAQLKRVYQKILFLGRYGQEPPENTFRRASEIVYNHAVRQVSRWLLVPKAIQSCSISSQEMGQSFGCIYDLNGKLFSLRFCISDETVAGVRNNTDVEVREYQSRLVFAVRLTRYLPEGAHLEAEEECDAEPEFCKKVRVQLGLFDSLSIQELPHLFRNEAYVPRLIRAIKDPARQLPIILVSELNRNDALQMEPLVDASVLALRLLGTAHVVRVSWNVAFALTDQLGKTWSCYNGSIRIFRPGGIDFDNDDPYLHPLYTLAKVERSNLVGAMEDYIVNQVLDFTHRRSPNWAAYGVKFYVEESSQRDEELHRTTLIPADAVALKEEIAALHNQVSSFHESAQEYKALADEYYFDMVAAVDDAKWQRNKLSALQAYIDRQRHEILRLRKGVPMSVPLGDTYDGIPAWIEKYYPDRLFLHPRAHRALKSAQFEDVELVYRCLQLLAEDYYDYSMGMFPWAEFIDRCHTIDPSLNEGTSVNDTTAGVYREDYYVLYGGERRKLARHLRKGNSRDPQYCLRIYFFWDPVGHLIVIGSLPGHLKIESS